MQLAKYVTNVDRFHAEYSEVVIKPIEGNRLVGKIAQNIEKMMNSKVDAIEVGIYPYISLNQ